jgi:hypothetical protein
MKLSCAGWVRAFLETIGPPPATLGAHRLYADSTIGIWYRQTSLSTQSARERHTRRHFKTSTHEGTSTPDCHRRQVTAASARPGSVFRENGLEQSR